MYAIATLLLGCLDIAAWCCIDLLEKKLAAKKTQKNLDDNGINGPEQNQKYITARINVPKATFAWANQCRSTAMLHLVILRLRTAYNVILIILF